MKFFLDNCLPPRWAPMLAALAEPGEYEVVHLRKKFDRQVNDVDWITKLGAEGGWTIVSGNHRITRVPHDREAWLNSGLTAFFLSTGWDLHFWEMTARIVRWWPLVLEQTKRVQPGAGFLVPARFGSGKFEQVRRGR